MRWQGRRVSTNVDDRRGMSGGLVFGGGAAGLIIAILLYLFNGNSDQLNNAMQSGGQPLSPAEQAEQDTLKQFVGVVLAETEDIWGTLFQQMGKKYTDPRLVLFTGGVQSACGMASAAAGPFYCPSDNEVYIDLSFYDELRQRFGASGDFAMAYVVAHEVGHHVQDLLGKTAEVENMRAHMSEKEYNKVSVALELQADFYAGIWAHYAESMHHILDPGDIDEALQAASAIGDDKLQMEAQGYVVPDAFTHGTSQQRMYWFKKGYATGDISQGNTFESLGI